MPTHLKRDLIELAAAYLNMLPSGLFNCGMAKIERHLDDTHLCWISGIEADSAFYYRIQSPVVFIEFDRHSGVYLTNPEPEKFHVHTIVRTPNGNDYGLDLLRLHYEQSEHHASRNLPTDWLDRT